MLPNLRSSIPAESVAGDSGTQRGPTSIVVGGPNFELIEGSVSESLRKCGRSLRTDRESKEEKAVFFEEMHDPDIQRGQKLRPGQHPWAVTRHQAWGEGEAELIEEPVMDNDGVQRRSAFEEDGTMTGTVQIIDHPARIDLGIPSHDEVGPTLAEPSGPLVQIARGEDDRTCLGVREEP